jgi:hypothetical protein
VTTVMFGVGFIEVAGPARRHALVAHIPVRRFDVCEYVLAWMWTGRVERKQETTRNLVRSIARLLQSNRHQGSVDRSTVPVGKRWRER